MQDTLSLASLRCVGSSVLPFQNVSAPPYWSRHEYGGRSGTLQRINFGRRRREKAALSLILFILKRQYHERVTNNIVVMTTSFP